MGSYLSNLHVRIDDQADRELIVYAIRSALIDVPEVRRGSTLRGNPTLPAVLAPPEHRTIAIAPHAPDRTWIAVYDSEAEWPGHQLTHLAEAVSRFVERPAVALSLAGDSIYAAVFADGDNQDSMSRPLDEIAADDRPSYLGNEEIWRDRLGVDARALRAAWDGTYRFGEQHLGALARALGIDPVRANTGLSYLGSTGLAEPGMTVLRYRWDAGSWLDA